MTNTTTNTTVKAMTEKEMLTYIKELLADNSAVTAFCDKKLEQLAKKNAHRSTSKAETAKQKANAELKTAIVEYMAEKASGAVTIKFLIDAVPALNGFTPQKVNALVKQLKDGGEVIRKEVKGVAYFAYADKAEEFFGSDAEQTPGFWREKKLSPFFYFFSKNPLTSTPQM